MRPTAIACLLVLASAVNAADGDRYLLPTAAGSGDGSAWSDATAATPASVATALATLQPGGILHLGSGTYPGLSIDVHVAGEPGRPVTIQGEDTGGGLPLLVGDWDHAKPAGGALAITVRPGVHDVVIAGLRLRRWQEGVSIRDGGVHDVRFADLDMQEMRSGFELAGGTDATKPAAWNERLVIERCRVVKYTKRGIRFRRGNRQVTVSDCLADAGGKDYAAEAFPMSFAIEGDRNAGKEGREALSDHDIRFERCEARGNWNDAGPGKYWNADGFCAEHSPTGLVYIDCRSSGNTDGGWDDKSAAPHLIRCTSSGNKRNFRMWNLAAPAVFEDCTGGPAILYGGSGDAADLWVKGAITATGCHFAGDPKVLSLGSGEAHATFTDCTFTAGPHGGSLWSAADAAQVSESGCTRVGGLAVPASAGADAAAEDKQP